MLGARGVQVTEMFGYMKQYCLYTEQVTFNAHKPGGSKIELVRPTACGRKRGGGGGLSGHAPQGKFNALRSLLRSFLDPSSALSVALGRLNSDSIYHVHMRRIYGLVAYWFEHRVYFLH